MDKRLQVALWTLIGAGIVIYVVGGFMPGPEAVLFLTGAVLLELAALMILLIYLVDH